MVVCALTRVALALRPETAGLEAGDLARSFAYGYYLDEEQVTPAERVAPELRLAARRKH